MPTFRYKIRDKYGRPLRGTMDAETKEAMFSYIKKAGYTAVVIEETKDVYLTKGVFARFKKVKLEDMILFTRQLVTLQSAGLPLLMSLSAIKDQTESGLLKDIITKLTQDIEAGLSFSDALSKHPKVFNELYINMTKAGEASGMLDNVLERLATLEEDRMQTRIKIRSATMYPIIVVFTLIAAFLAMVTFVLPRFAELFLRFGVTLPIPTRILLFISGLVLRWWHVLIVVTAVAAFSFKRYINTKAGRLIWDDFRLRVPVFGSLVLKITMARFTRTASALIRSGIPLLQVLGLVSKTTGNVIVARSIENIKHAVNEGKPMHEPMKLDKLFPPIVTQMVAVGESTGKLEELLLRVADYYDSQVDYMLKNLTTAIEPILIFCLGGMVLTMALAIFLPLWDIIQVFKK